jgi:excisionase family DNA binding protein
MLMRAAPQAESPLIPTQSAATALTVRIPEACRLTGIGRSKLYELIRAGKIRTIKVGTITLIPVGSLAEFLGIQAR